MTRNALDSPVQAPSADLTISFCNHASMRVLSPLKQRFELHHDIRRPIDVVFGTLLTVTPSCAFEIWNQSLSCIDTVQMSSGASSSSFASHSRPGSPQYRVHALDQSLFEFNMSPSTSAMEVSVEHERPTSPNPNTGGMIRIPSLAATSIKAARRQSMANRRASQLPRRLLLELEDLTDHLDVAPAVEVERYCRHGASVFASRSIASGTSFSSLRFLESPTISFDPFLDRTHQAPDNDESDSAE